MEVTDITAEDESEQEDTPSSVIAQADDDISA